MPKGKRSGSRKHRIVTKKNSGLSLSNSAIVVISWTHGIGRPSIRFKPVDGEHGLQGAIL